MKEVSHSLVQIKLRVLTNLFSREQTRGVCFYLADAFIQSVGPLEQPGVKCLAQGHAGGCVTVGI